MKKIVSALALAGMVGAPGVVMAEEPASPHTLTGNITLTSDYVFRGVSQTQGGPAIQGGFDYAHASGFYVGTWASNVAWVKEGGFKDDSSMEIDLYGGFKGAAGDFGYDVGVITYYYPGDKNTVNNYASPNTTEVYLGASWKFLSMKYSHVVSSNFIGWVNPVNGDESKNSGYIELNASYDLGSGWGILGHAGYQKVANYETATGDDADYSDWKVGVTKDIGFGTVALAYTDTNADIACCYTIAGEEIADGRVFVSFSKSF